MAETILDFNPAEWHVTIVSGFGNDTALVQEPHEQLADEWRRQGLSVVTIHPDYEGDLGTAIEKIEKERKDAMQAGRKVLSVGSSAGGTVTSLERVLHALNIGEVQQPLSDLGITICSRADLLDHSEKYGGKYPTAWDLREQSPLLHGAAERLVAVRDLVSFTPQNTISFSAGRADQRIPPESSVLPGARASLIQPGTGATLDHSSAVRRVLSTPSYRRKMLSLAGKAQATKPG